MADKSKIEWTDATWNPITGCSIVSPGCTHCYAMKLAGTRLKHHPSRKGLTTMSKTGPVWNGKVRFNEDWLTQPLHWSRPRMIFVCAHGDLFHEDVPDEWIDKVFAVMASAEHHRFQVLTKRADRMRAAISRMGKSIDVLDRQARLFGRTLKWTVPSDLPSPLAGATVGLVKWPLPNVWLGVSAERQQEADARIPDLLATSAAVRFVSLEPLLGPIDLTVIERRHAGGFMRPLDGRFNTLDWIIVGGESGDGASPMHPTWVRALRDQCAAAGNADRFFFKQWGEWAPTDVPQVVAMADGMHDDRWRFIPDTRSSGPLRDKDIRDALTGRNGTTMVNIGKKAAGRLLDGVEHNGMPV